MLYYNHSKGTGSCDRRTGKEPDDLSKISPSHKRAGCFVKAGDDPESTKPAAGFVWRKGSPAAEVPAKFWGYPCRSCRRPCVRFGHRGHIPSRPTVVGFSDNGGFFIQERRARSPGDLGRLPGCRTNPQALADLGACLGLLKSAGACRFTPLPGRWKSDSAVGFAAALVSRAAHRWGGCTP